jgi:hypothetical protein
VQYRKIYFFGFCTNADKIIICQFPHPFCLAHLKLDRGPHFAHRCPKSTQHELIKAISGQAAALRLDQNQTLMMETKHVSEKFGF